MIICTDYIQQGKFKKLLGLWVGSGLGGFAGYVVKIDTYRSYKPTVTIQQKPLCGCMFMHSRGEGRLTGSRDAFMKCGRKHNIRDLLFHCEKCKRVKRHHPRSTRCCSSLNGHRCHYCFLHTQLLFDQIHCTFASY